MYSCAGAITNSTFTGNQATNGGGALSACTGETTNCTFTANQAANAGGALHYCTGQITNCTFIANQAGGAGGAMYKCSRRVTSSVFSSNRAGSNGGAIYIVHPWGYELGLGLWNCTLSGNSAGAYGGGIFSAQSGPTLTNCVVWGNSDSSGSGESAQIYTGAAHVTFSCIQDDDPNDANIPFGGADANNIDDDPMFVRDPNDGGDGWGYDPCTADVNEAANDDYGDLHLRYNSPCIDGGDPLTWLGPDSVDMDGETRIMAGRVDMGADEYFVPWITVIAPQAGDVWAAGSWREIEWQSYAVAGMVDISYSDDNGGQWTTIENDVPNAGSYLWELPLGVDSNQCLVSVAPSTPDPNVVLIDSGLFTIHPDAPGPDVPAWWRSLGGDFDRSGLSDTYGPELGCLKWQFQTDGEVAGSVTVGMDNRVHIACEEGELYTLDANGALLWSYDTNSPLLSSPTIGPDGTVYVGSEDGTLFAIDIDGNVRWTHTAGDFIYASPAVSAGGNTVFVGSGDGVLYALGRDGSELWSFQTTGFGVTTGAIFASPAIGIDGTVYVGAVSDPNLYALDPNDGSVKWVCRFEFWRRPQEAHLGPELGWPFTSPVVATDGTIYQKSLYDPNLYAIDPDSGDIIWSLDCGDGWSEPVLGPDGTIYAGQADSNLLAIDPNGGVKWTRRLGTAGGLSMTVGNDGLLYAAGYDGYFGVIDPNGEELARFQSDTWLFAPVIAADGTVIVSDGSDRVLAIGADDCEQEVLLLHRLEDLDGSGWVNFKDFALLAMDWLACNDLAGPCYGEAWDGTYFIGDVDRNRYVDWLDVAALADRWLAGE
jgi:outer membrane protein assembly factor BamB